MHNALMSTAEVADLLRVTPSTVSRMVDRGDLQFQHKSPGMRGAMLFDPAVISAYVAAQEAKDQKSHDEAEAAALKPFLDRSTFQVGDLA